MNNEFFEAMIQYARWKGLISFGIYLLIGVVIFIYAIVKPIIRRRKLKRNREGK